MILHLLLVLLCAGAGIGVVGQPLLFKTCPALTVQANTLLSYDCSVQTPLRKPSSVLGGNLTISSEPGIEHAVGSTTLSIRSLADLVLPDTQINLVNLVIQGLSIPLELPPRKSVRLVDTRLIVPPSVVVEYAQSFGALAQSVPSAGSVPSLGSLNDTAIYTDNTSFFHIAYGGSSNWAASVSLLALQDHDNATSLQRAAAEDVGVFSSSTRNFIISATNTTLVPALLAHAGVVTATPLLVYVTDNITLAFSGGYSGAPLPAGGIPINRPVIMVGRKSQITSIDFRMDVNQFDLHTGGSPYSSMTMDSLVFENLGVGSARSAELAYGASLSATTFLWPILYNRTELRLFIRNCTYVVASPVELDFNSYWSAAWNSPLPYFQSQVLWTRLKQAVTSWITEPSKGTNSSFVLVEFISGSLRLYDSVLTVVPQVAAPLPLPPPDALTPPLEVNQAAPLVEVIANVSELPVLAAEPIYNVERPRVILIPTNMSFAPDASTGWPPQGGLRFDDPITLTGPPDNSSNPMWQPASNVEIDSAGSRSLLRLPRTSRTGQLSVQLLQLAGLPQGPRADGIGSLEADAFTILLWQIDRPFIQPGVLQLENVTLLLPAPEMDFILSQRVSDDGVLGIQPAGVASDTITFTNCTVAGPNALLVGSLTGYGISGTNVLLRMDPNTSRSQPPGYNWPPANGASIVTVGQSAPAQGLPGWLIAVIVVLVLVAVGAAVAGLVLSRRRKAIATDKRRGVESPMDALSPAAPSVGRSSSSRGSRSWLLPLLRAASSMRHRSTDVQARATSMSFNATCDDIAAAITGLPRSARDRSDVESAGAMAGYVGTRAAGPIKEEASSSRSRDTADTVGADVRDGQRLKVAKAEQLAHQVSEQQRLGVVGPTPSFVMGTMRRLHTAISTVSQDLQQRRVEAALPSRTPATPQTPPAPHGNGSQHNTPDGSGTGSSSAAQSGRRTDSHGSGSHGGPPAAANAPSTTAQLQLFDVLGTGNFGTVYRGLWRGTPVAVKVMHVPASSLQGLQQGVLRQDDRQEQDQQQEGAAEQKQRKTREHMAVNEVALSSSISHYHIVQVYTYSLRPQHLALKEDMLIGSLGPTASPEGRASSDFSAFRASLADGVPSSTRSMPPIVNWELRLVMEYCDQGSLRSLLDKHRFHDPETGHPHHPTATALALDVAYAMLHLHSESILHGDLKSSNVLIKQVLASEAPTAAGPTAGTSSIMLGAVPGARLVAKVADFGLSLVMDPMATHVSHMHAGTLTHMAPELLTHGHASKASDVYAFGIVMWELATGGRAFAGTPRALLGHQVAQERRRPAWPAALASSPVVSPFAAGLGASRSTRPSSEQRYLELAERCWGHEPAHRPTFEEIVEILRDILAGLLAGQQQQQAQPAWQGQREHPFAESRDVTECSSWGNGAVAVLPYFPGATAGAAGSVEALQQTGSIPTLQQPAEAQLGERPASVSMAGGGMTDSGGLSYTGLQRIVSEVLRQERAERLAQGGAAVPDSTEPA